jgi:hypothetical protein
MSQAHRQACKGLKRRNSARTAVAFDTSSSLFQASLHLTNCRQEIDGILFHDSSFIDSVLVYYGKGPLLFSHSNVVTGSTLMLGQSVPLNNPVVKDLVCSFPWKATIRQDQTPVALPCT